MNLLRLRWRKSRTQPLNMSNNKEEQVKQLKNALKRPKGLSDLYKDDNDLGYC